jgi:anti-sigma factor RsiW
MSHLGNQISALIDGELGGVELDRANAHLAGCAACQAEAAELRQLKRELRALGELDCADAVTSRLLAMVGPGGPGAPAVPGSGAGGAVTARPLQRQPGRRARRRRGRYAMWGAMSLVVVGVGAAAFGMGGGSSANEPQITPQLEVYDLQHAISSGDVPFADPADTQASRAVMTTVNAPFNALLLRLAAEETRP